MANLNWNQLVAPLTAIVLALIAAAAGYRLEVSLSGGLRFEPPSKSQTQKSSLSDDVKVRRETRTEMGIFATLSGATWPLVGL